ncbi:hypothetical protein [Sinorhizobium fredii]|uniref:Uncharacterized protein n=1 Tax=Sinorhizobium sojae CCBAU 05684 TaxID=716928 RepID=A0A249PNH5_9HYPH|nr:hypothetical protein [Sinorhizobium fredii]ASY67214.1 hypothetical protein SJ05684_a39000 [Sinorhizobium sojae CCBAU 05684]
MCTTSFLVVSLVVISSALSATVHDGDAVGYSHDVVHVVRDVDDRDTL